MRFGWEYKKKNRKEFLTLKDIGYCDKCQREATTDHLWSYVDGNNSAITKHSPTLCEKCCGYRNI